MTHEVVTTVGHDPLFVVDEAAHEVRYNGNLLNAAEGILTLTQDSGLKSVYPSPAYILGVQNSIATGLVATDNTSRAMVNSHLSLIVNSLTGSGTVTITGDIVSESTGVISLGATEDITVDASGRYQTDSKWVRITQVLIPGGITVIDYDLEQIEYWNFSNNNFTVTGYRNDVTPTNAGLVSYQLEIIKVQDDGNKKSSLVPIEDIILDGSGSPYITDNIRSGGDDRGYTTALPFITGIPCALKQTDFRTYFSSDENVIEGSTKQEGLIIKLTWSNVDYYLLHLNFLAD